MADGQAHNEERADACPLQLFLIRRLQVLLNELDFSVDEFLVGLLGNERFPDVFALAAAAGAAPAGEREQGGESGNQSTWPARHGCSFHGLRVLSAASAGSIREQNPS